jgi:DNA repair exonuclease SbcCD ATPase subunit
VSANGKIHGCRIFAPYPTFAVATDPILDYERRIAYLPWRELPEEQAALFDGLPAGGAPWTIFGHAEVKGAAANGGHVAPGRVTSGQILSRARACYLGHYHKRQAIDGAVWYVGSPFEQNFGERNDPHGIALVTHDKIEPDFFELSELPRHHRLTLADPATGVRPHDIVEVYVERDQIDSEAVRAYLADLSIPSARVLPLAVEGEEAGAPAVALSMAQAIDAYVKSRDGDLELAALGRMLLQEVPEAATHPLASQVDIMSLRIVDFCAVRGEVTLDLDRKGLALLKGPIGVGKTAIMDALSWGLYGETAPRKAGAHSATFKADEVINDYADSCLVEVKLGLGSLWPEVIVRRTKKRGSGAKLVVKGLDAETGISDTQELVSRAIGLDYTLWRACVSLGQGAVGNFATDADKRRKEILSTAFGLDRCPKVLDLVRSRLKGVRASRDRAQSELLGADQVLVSLQDSNFDAQIKKWEEQRDADAALAKQGEAAAQATIAECDSKLADEAKWIALKTPRDTRVETLTKQLVAFTSNAKLFEITRDLGAAQAERSLSEQKLAHLNVEIGNLEAQFEASASLTCPSCGRPMDATHAEKHLSEKRHEATRLQSGMRTFDARITNLKHALDQQLTQLRTELDQINTALNTFARLRANRADSGQRVTDYRARLTALGAAVNPFAEEQARLAAKVAAQQTRCEALRKSSFELAEQEEGLDFWETGFSAKGIPVLVLRTVIHELEVHANRFLSQLLQGKLYCQISLVGEDLQVELFEQTALGIQPRRYEQLSGGQRRCVELAFSPFALSEMIFARCGVRVPFLVVDELTTHLGAEEKPIVCEILRALDRNTVLVIDHDVSVQAEFDTVLEVGRDEDGSTTIARAA